MPPAKIIDSIYPLYPGILSSNHKPILNPTKLQIDAIVNTTLYYYLSSEKIKKKDSFLSKTLLRPLLQYIK